MDEPTVFVNGFKITVGAGRVTITPPADNVYDIVVGTPALRFRNMIGRVCGWQRATEDPIDKTRWHGAQG